MRKIDKEEIGANIIVGIIIFSIIIIVGFLYHMEETYELTKYLFIIDIIILIITPIYHIIYNTIEKRKTKQLEDKMIIRNIEFEYYRDIIKEYSPATLSFILDGIELQKDISASILYLVKEGYLALGEGNTIQRTKKNCNKIPKDLKLLCNSDISHLMVNEKLYTKSEEEKKLARKASRTKTKWVSLVEEQAKEAGLVIERKESKVTSLLSILCILEIIYTFTIDALGLTVFSFVLIFILSCIRYGAFLRNKWVKTQKGYEIYQKVVGLKNYIKDYSILSEKELNEIVLWDDYLIYAIILNDTSKLNKEAMQFYKKVCDRL